MAVYVTFDLLTPFSSVMASAIFVDSRVWWLVFKVRTSFDQVSSVANLALADLSTV